MARTWARQSGVVVTVFVEAKQDLESFELGTCYSAMEGQLITTGDSLAANYYKTVQFEYGKHFTNLLNVLETYVWCLSC